MKRTLYLLTLGTAFSAAALDDGFTPYRTIIDRMPLGRPGESTMLSTFAGGAGAEGGGAAGVVLDPEKEKDIERIRASVRVCAVNAPPGAEPVVGFTDMSQNPPRHHLLSQGQSKDGWSVVLIDAAARHAVLSRDGISVPLYLGTAAPPAPLAPDGRAEAQPSQDLQRNRKHRIKLRRPSA